MASYEFASSAQWGAPLYPLGGTSQSLLPHVAHTPQPVPSSTWDHGSPYRLTVKQQPERAKAANAKDKDRKPVDPPPILQLDVDPGQDPLQVYITSPYLFVQTFLIGSTDAEPEPDLNSLTGNTCTSGHVVKDDRGVHNMMFCLNDISVKKEGTYRLKFCLFKLNTTTGDVENLTSICSQPFTTYSGRHFPGMSESTSMTRLLVDAGVRLRLRKESKAMSTKKKNNAFAQMIGRRSTGGGSGGPDDDDDRPVKRMRSEPSDKDTMSSYSKHGSFSNSHSHSYNTGHSTPSTTMAHFPSAFHAGAAVTSSPGPNSMTPIGSMPGPYNSNLHQLGLDTQVGHYHSPPSAGSSYQSPGRGQSPSAYPMHGSAGTATSQPMYSSHAAGGPVLPPVDMAGASHGSSSPDMNNYTTSAAGGYNGGYMPSSTGASRTLPGMHAPHSHHRSGSLGGGLRMGGLPNGHGGSAAGPYGEAGGIFEPYGYAPRDGH